MPMSRAGQFEDSNMNNLISFILSAVIVTTVVWIYTATIAAPELGHAFGLAKDSHSFVVQTDEELDKLEFQEALNKIGLTCVSITEIEKGWNVAVPFWTNLVYQSVWLALGFGSFFAVRRCLSLKRKGSESSRVS